MAEPECKIAVILKAKYSSHSRIAGKRQILSKRIAINGFGRIGRLATRAAQAIPDVQIIHINEVAGDAATAAHLLQFDSVHGRWDVAVEAVADALLVDGQRISYSSNTALEETPWQQLGVDVVVDCTGKFKTNDSLKTYLQQGVPKVVVSAPIKEAVRNIVVGVNDHLYDAEQDHIVSAASCTTNCIAPVIGVVHEHFKIKHGAITTIHDITNTQSVLDDFHKDLRRARASSMSLIPTTTGSATAITEIFPELHGKLNGIAVRVPLANASLADCVFELERSATADAVNEVLKNACQGHLHGILGVEDRPLVSIDYRGDSRSGIVDAQSTQVIDGTQVKLLIWYDNETGYVQRMMELVTKVANSM